MRTLLRVTTTRGMMTMPVITVDGTVRASFPWLPTHAPCGDASFGIEFQALLKFGMLWERPGVKKYKTNSPFDLIGSGEAWNCHHEIKTVQIYGKLSQRKGTLGNIITNGWCIKRWMNILNQCIAIMFYVRSDTLNSHLISNLRSHNRAEYH